MGAPEEAPPLPRRPRPFRLPWLLSQPGSQALGTVHKSNGNLTLQKTELPGEGAVGTSCERDTGAGCVALQWAQPACFRGRGARPVAPGRGRATQSDFGARLKRSMPEGGVLGLRDLPSNQHLQYRLIQVVAEDRLRKLG